MKTIAKPSLSLFDLERKGFSTSPDTIGQYIRNVRLQRGMNQERFAAMLANQNEMVLRDQDIDLSAPTGNLGISGSGLNQRIYPTCNASYDVTSLVLSTGSVVQRMYYGLDGAQDFASASGGTEIVNLFNWSYGFQGGRVDAVTGFVKFSETTGAYNSPGRWWNTQGWWETQEPSETDYIDGTNLYWGFEDDPESYLDPTGLLPQLNNPEFCAMLKKRLANLTKQLQKRQRQLSTNPQGLPNLPPYPGAPPSLSQDGHRMLLAGVIGLIKRTNDLIDKFCPCEDDKKNQPETSPEPELAPEPWSNPVDEATKQQIQSLDLTRPVPPISAPPPTLGERLYPYAKSLDDFFGSMADQLWSMEQNAAAGIPGVDPVLPGSGAPAGQTIPEGIPELAN